MRAIAAFPAAREVRVVDHPEPRLEHAEEVLVRTLEVGVCGTDGELCAFHFGHAPRGEEYLVLGHEALGVVEQVGAAVDDLRPGDLVVPSVRRPCDAIACPACRSGSQDFCVTGDYTERGIFGAHGFLTERFVEGRRYLYPLPDAVSTVGVLVEPLTIAEKGVRQYVSIQRRLPWLSGAGEDQILTGRRAVVLGAGPVGLLGAMLLRLRGCHVTVYSREAADDPRADLARRMGARYLSGGEIPVAALPAETGAIDLVYEAAGSPALSLAVAGAMGPNGVFILTGATGGGGRLEFGADAMLNHMVGRNVVVAGTVNASHADFVRAVDDLGRFAALWPEALDGIITSRHPLEEFASLALHRAGIKQVIDLDIRP